MDALGVNTVAALVDRLGLGASSYGTVNRWYNGISEPLYESTMLLLEAAGWLVVENPTARAERIVRQLDAGEEFDRVRLEALADELDQVAAATRLLAHRLRKDAKAGSAGV